MTKCIKKCVKQIWQYQYRFKDVLCGIITFLLHPLLHEVNSEFEIKVFFFQSCDLLQVIETFP